MRTNKINKTLEIDFRRYFPNKITFFKKIKLILSKDLTYKRWKYIKYMRLCDNIEYNNNLFNNVKKIYLQRKKNELACSLGFEINSKNIGEGLLLYHNGPIVINGNSTIGKNCSFHGDNCVGNNGVTNDCPIIGDNVDIGVGAKIIGNVRIASNVKIGAGSIVVTDITVEGSTVVGVPGKVIKK